MITNKKYSISNILFDDNVDCLKTLNSNNIYYIEIAPSKIINWEDSYSVLKNKIKDYLIVCDDYNITPIMMQSLFYQIEYNLFENKNEFIEHFKKIYDLSNLLDIKYLIFGSPKNRFKNNVNISDNIFLDTINEITLYDKNIYICLETNPIVYNSNFITTEQEKNFLIKNSNNNLKSHIDTSSLILNNDYTDLHYDNSLTMHISSPFLKKIDNKFFDTNNEMISTIINNVEIISLECSDRNDIDTTINIFKKLIKKES